MQRLLQVVITAWREAERVASERPDGSQEQKAAVVAAGRLRDLHAELVASAKADSDIEAVRAAEEARRSLFPESA